MTFMKFKMEVTSICVLKQCSVHSTQNINLLKFLVCQIIILTVLCRRPVNYFWIAELFLKHKYCVLLCIYILRLRIWKLKLSFFILNCPIMFVLNNHTWSLFYIPGSVLKVYFLIVHNKLQLNIFVFKSY